MLAAHPFSGFALDATQVSYVAAPIGFTIGVDDLPIEARLWYSKPVVVAHHWCGIHDNRDNLAISRFSQERDDAVFGVVKIDPIESVVGIVELPERRLLFVSVIQMLHQPAKSVMPGQFQ